MSQFPTPDQSALPTRVQAWPLPSEAAPAGPALDLEEASFEEVRRYALDKEWLWQDWLDALDETEVDDCRWTPCFDCGVCPQLGTQIEVGPTGRTLLPVTVLGAGRERMAEATHSHA